MVEGQNFTFLEYAVLLYSIVYSFMLYAACDGKGDAGNIVSLIMNIVAVGMTLFSFRIEGGAEDIFKFVPLALAFASAMVLYFQCKVGSTSPKFKDSDKTSKLNVAVVKMFPALITVVSVMVLIYIGEYMHVDEMEVGGAFYSGGEVPELTGFEHYASNSWK